MTHSRQERTRLIHTCDMTRPCAATVSSRHLLGEPSKESSQLGPVPTGEMSAKETYVCVLETHICKRDLCLCISDLYIWKRELYVSNICQRELYLTSQLGPVSTGERPEKRDLCMCIRNPYT